MTTIESKTVTIQADPTTVFDFLLDLNNYQLLLPKNVISDWESDAKHCSFKVQKMYKLALVYHDSKPETQVHIKSGEGSPFSFDLYIHLNNHGETLEAHLICEADINPMLKMMVQKPLNNLFDYMAERLVKVSTID